MNSPPPPDGACRAHRRRGTGFLRFGASGRLGCHRRLGAGAELQGLRFLGGTWGIQIQIQGLEKMVMKLTHHLGRIPFVGDVLPQFLWVYIMVLMLENLSPRTQKHPKNVISSNKKRVSRAMINFICGCTLLATNITYPLPEKALLSRWWISGFPVGGTCFPFPGG